ncbi:hypothetical protein B0T20DRAFT_407002 [Sordaria brevicollis]|uniref:Nucleoside-diphosphate-sugar epimerase n=1 Tax=Sordaria brevicollis TaxID=83679 RepID=A0AAE0UDU4_SORBR|nr:hypothetical protein B0T20DRAFT_407002 [Sordaria brevicollis]
MIYISSWVSLLSFVALSLPICSSFFALPIPLSNRTSDTNKMHLILTGATGLVGSAVLDAMIKTPDISKISIISRRPVKMAEDAKDPRINVILHKDFEKYDSDLLNQLEGATGCVWALGVSQNAVGKEEYIRITKSFPLAAATAFQSLSPSSSTSTSSPLHTQPNPSSKPFHFIYISGEGATTTPPSSLSLPARLTTPYYAIIKGQAELALSSLSSPTFFPISMRPGYVDPSSHSAILPYIPKLSTFMTLAVKVLGPPIRVGYKKLWSPTEELGKGVVEMAMGRWDGDIKREIEDGGNGFEKLQGGGVVIGNVGWRRVAGLGL